MVFFEGIAEMPDIFIAQHVSCFIDFTVGGDQFGGLIHFQLGDVGNIGLPCFALKQCAEIRGIHIKIAGDGIQGKIFHDMVGYEPVSYTHLMIFRTVYKDKQYFSVRHSMETPFRYSLLIC